MVKRAVCVGINEYPQDGMALQGCVNDADGWASLLVDHYDFPKPDVRVVLDTEATHDRIIGELQWLMGGTSDGDVLVFTNSSHGTYLADLDGDEPDYDEALCPYDVADKPLSDDELRLLISDLPRGVRLTVISDSCHSGTVTRGVRLPTPDQRRVRFMNPRIIGRDLVPNVQMRVGRGQRHRSDAGMTEVLLSGCQANQYSIDAVIAGTPHGAFTFHALAAIRSAGYRLTYDELHHATITALQASSYDQDPQLEGSEVNKRRQVFT